MNSVQKVYPVDMPIKTLLVIIVSLCLLDSTVGRVLLEAVGTHSRAVWGINDVSLRCRDDEKAFEIINALFTRNGDPITTNHSDICTPSTTTYCVNEDGSRLNFIVSSETEGWFACENSANVASESLAIIGEHFIVSL